jgi:Flp pilus assembly pilin Flp
MVEYALLVALIAIIGIAASGSVGEKTSDQFEVLAAEFDGGSVPDVPGDGSESGTPDDQGQDQDDQSGDNADSGAGDDINHDQAGDDQDTEQGQDDQGQDQDDQDQDDQGQDQDDDSNGGSGDDTVGGDESGDETPVEPGSTVAETSASAGYYWWNHTKNGGEGAWKAEVSYQNTWIRHQYLTLEVTRVDDKGNATTTTVKDFYVPANGSSTFTLWENALSVNKSHVKGTVSVTVKVTGIRTSDESWNTVTFPGDGSTSVVGAPEIP